MSHASAIAILPADIAQQGCYNSPETAIALIILPQTGGPYPTLVPSAGTHAHSITSPKRRDWAIVLPPEG
ncbi:hypothetical protein [Phormidium sp. CCY1219]|uniref:hypothetical protein n=1 Tax=Phormidium sp. CCY1219 TaxID=2886104 RepID=UPI002D1EAF99|nr:hypothetical protein [Phormidium sp. CCY1219]MEB3828267.1 hypothetical protein [Phormidium sp. CCY1219]